MSAPGAFTFFACTIVAGQNPLSAIYALELYRDLTLRCLFVVLACQDREDALQSPVEAGCVNDANRVGDGPVQLEGVIANVENYKDGSEAYDDLRYRCVAVADLAFVEEFNVLHYNQQDAVDYVPGGEDEEPAGAFFEHIKTGY